MGFPVISMRYGKEEGINKLWREICQIDEKEVRNNKVDELVLRMVKNKDKNGFWGPEDVLVISHLFMEQFKLDDMDIYHNFFSVLNEKTKKDFSFKTYAESIFKTVTDYFGKIPKDNKKRAELTAAFFDNNDEFIVPSIKELKNKDSAACVEYAAISHNLWLLSGVESYFIKNLTIEHAFNIVHTNSQYFMFDLVQGISKPIESDSIKKIENQEELVINGFTYSKNENKEL